MKVPLNWIKDFTPVDIPPSQLVEKIGAQLGAVDEVINLGQKYKGALVTRVISTEKHPNADKLSVCMIDTGKTKPVQVVCGAPNVAAGQSVVWLPPGSTVPSSYDKEPFVLEAREIRGQMSNGMIASAKELALGDDHTGILVLEEGIKPGTSFAAAYGLDGIVIDIENKMFTHRPDLFGMLGIARELAGIRQKPFRSPAWYRADAELTNDGRKNVLKLAVKNQLPELVPRFMAVTIKDIKVQDSPVWLKARLSAAGVRPINNIVDLTNYIMLETAQPLHAYDYDKLKTGVLGARLSRKGEKLRLLGGKEITLKDGAVVITDGHKPVGLGGIMGGADTEVDENTRSIILECANFDMNRTRKTAMEYGLFTDAATRFTKNQSPRQNRAVIIKAVEDILKLAGGRMASPLVDDKHYADRRTTLKTDAGFINRRLGLELTAAQIRKILENVEFEVKTEGEGLAVTAPFWRTDIAIPEDIVEEVGRLYGYDKLPVVLPSRSLAPAVVNPLLALKDRLRAVLSSAGANEVLTYSFAHGSLLEKAGQDPSQAYRIANALSPDLQYYRLSLTPSLLEKIHPNIRAGFSEFAIFELGKVHNLAAKDQAEPRLPREFEMLSLVTASSRKSVKDHGAPFYQARAALGYLAEELGLELDYRPFPAEEPYQVVKPFDHRRSAQVWDKKTGSPLGMIGEYRQSVISSLKLPRYCAGFELDIQGLLQAAPAHQGYRPLNRFPEVEQDFCLRSAAGLRYAELTDFIDNNLRRLSAEPGYNYLLKPLDIFRRAGDTKHKQMTWRITLWHPERTLTVAETNKLLDGLAGLAKKELKAERI